MASEERGGPPAGGRLRHAPWVDHGLDLSRLLALSDGVFAFAMTLLVLGLAIPAGLQASGLGAVLQHLWGAFYAYVISFFVIYFYWQAHQILFRYIDSYDRRLLQLNGVFLFFIVLLPFVTTLISVLSVPLTVAMYALVQVAAGVALLGVWWDATYERRHVPKEMPATWIDYISFRSALSPIVFAISVPIALWRVDYAEASWLAVFAGQLLLRWRRAGRGGARTGPGSEG
jgi:uncharacterized membrane protein